LTGIKEFNTFDGNCTEQMIHTIPNVQTQKENKMKILVGYDGSRVAEDALKLAHEHARVFNADIHLFTSLQQGPELQKEDIEEAESRLDKLKLDCNLDKTTCETHTSVSFLTPGEDLVLFAKNNDVDYIFIGVRKRSKVGKLVFGSTAQQVILEAPCPVVTVK
jgi:nucleotide-binding universal stress UspA family protein